MFLAEPQRTAYDINFQLFGFPVRIHPGFWLMGLLLGYGGGQPDGFQILTWILVLFVSILIHELGHALMFRRFGEAAHIVLYWMGGLAVPGDDAPHSPWSSYSSSSSFGRRANTPAQRIIIAFAGPAAGFLFAAFIVLGVFAAGGSVRPALSETYAPDWLIDLGEAMAGNVSLWMLVYGLLQFNVWWGLINLLPVFPLDGGQISQQVLTVNDPWGGTERALWLSIIVAIAMAVAGGLVFRQMFIVLLFLSLAANSYFLLQQLRGGGGRPW